jgi:hypothetical protein
MNAGRKKIYKPETLEVGQRMEMRGKAKRYVHQYIRSFNKRKSGMEFKFAPEGENIFVERVK